MEYIILKGIEKAEQRIQYSFEVSDGLKCYFSETPFLIEYPESVNMVPNAVAAVPFVCNVLPIIWLTDSKLVVPELDEAFFRCIPEVKKGYEDMYPETELRGTVEVGSVVPCDRKAVPGSCALFYSGGVDSMEALFRHVEEKPTLISIWGSDISYDNDEGWTVLQTPLEEAAREYNLDRVVIKSRFREFDSESALNKAFGAQLQRNYWYGLKHALGLLGHVAVYAYLHDMEVMYIASSNCPADGQIRCASDPRTDNHVRFAGCHVVHDGFELTRQDKVGNIVRYSERTGKHLPLHVCWKTQTGNNCGVCEKCYRTMTALILENADPVDYSFPNARRELPYMQVRMATAGNSAPKTWNRLHEDVKARQKLLRHNSYWKYIKWLVKADFLTPGALKMPLKWRIRNKLSQHRFFRILRKIARKLLRR